MKVLFLDFDGVLVGDRYLSKLTAAERGTLKYFDPVCVRRLATVLGSTGAKVVVSSSWRLGRSVFELAELLYSIGLPRRFQVVGKTPVLPGPRGDEIFAWMALYPGQVSYYAIVDDYEDMGELTSRLVRTDPAFGLTDGDVHRLVGKLGWSPYGEFVPRA